MGIFDFWKKKPIAATSTVTKDDNTSLSKRQRRRLKGKTERREITEEHREKLRAAVKNQQRDSAGHFIKSVQTVEDRDGRS